MASIRLAQQGDQHALLALMQAHAQYEGQQLPVRDQAARLANLNSLPVTIYVVEVNGQLQGYISFVQQFSTWDLAWYLYIDCLYLTPEFRGLGLGHELMQIAKHYAKQQGIAQLQWQTPAENSLAIGFYQKLGAKALAKQRFIWPA